MRFGKLMRAATVGVPLIVVTLASDPIAAQFREIGPKDDHPAASSPLQIQLAPTSQPFVTPRQPNSGLPKHIVPEPVASPQIDASMLQIQPVPSHGVPAAVERSNQTSSVGVQRKQGEPTPATVDDHADSSTSDTSRDEGTAEAELKAEQPTIASSNETPSTGTSRDKANAPSHDNSASDAAPAADTIDRSTAEDVANAPSESNLADTQGPRPSNEDPFAAFGPDNAAADVEAPAALTVASPVQFNRVTPGETSVSQVEKLWGAPAKSIATNNGERRIYRAPGFAQVDLSIVDDTVDSTLIHLAEPVSLSELERPLDLSDIRPVKIDDAEGQPLGYAYPERGVLLTFAPGSDQARVSHVLLEPVRGELYRLRAELDQRCDYSRCLADLEEAVRLDPQDARAYWLQSELLSWAGKSEDAMDCVRIAIRIAPENVLYQLTEAKYQANNGERSKALSTTRRIAEAAKTPEVVRARAEYQWGNLLANGTDPDFQKGLNHHMKAVELAAKFLEDDRHERRRMAKDIVVDAHLAIAQDIALGNFQRQREVVPKWLTRATELAEAFIAEDGGDPTMRMQIYRTTLAVYSVMQGNFDASIATEEAVKESRRLIAEADDRMYQSYVERELAEALYHAAKVEHRCGRSDRAIRYANNAVVLTESGDDVVQPTPFDRLMQGQLYFFTGSIYAVHKQDHAEAAKWYDKALPAFDDQRLVDLVDTSAFGELFVSMGVSYWNTGQKEKAIKLTEAGSELMQQGVQAGKLELIAMSVPYGNLAAMHRENGNSQKATHFTELMAKIEQDAGERY